MILFLIIYLTNNYQILIMKKQTNTFFTFWGLAFILVACLLPFMARENNFLNQFLSYCITFIK